MTKIIAIVLILTFGILAGCNSGGAGESGNQNTASSNQTSAGGSDNATSANNITTAAENSGTEKRCGWYFNPTPANHYLFDKDGRWVIGEQGGYQVDDKSFDNLPKFGNEWVADANGNYGYGCACLDVTVDKKAKKILSIKKGERLPLSKCRADKNLEEPFIKVQKSGTYELVVNGVKSGSGYSTIVKQLGKPESEENVGDNECTGAHERRLKYEGLEITVETAVTHREYSLLDIKVTSSKWVTDKGIKIGATPEQVMAAYEETEYEDAPDNPGEKWLAYDMKNGPGGIHFYFKNDKLVRIELKPTLC